MRADFRIGVMYLNTSPFAGGALYGLRSIVRQLDKRRFRAVVVFTADRPEFFNFFRGVETELVALPMLARSPRSPRVLLDWLHTARELAQLVGRFEVQILHSTSPRAAVLGPLVRWRTGARFVWQVAMLGQGRTLHWLARFADAAPCVSRAVYQEYGARPNMTVIHNGPWTERLSAEECAARRRELRGALGIHPDELVIGAVANLQYWKGIHVLLEAFARVSTQLPGALLVHFGGAVPGYEHYARRIEARIASLELGERIRRMGFREDAYRYYPVFDILVHAPVFEGKHRTSEAFGHSVAEAMGYRLPVVASRIGGPAEILEEGITGELVEPGDVAELGEKILALARDPARRQRMGEAGYARYLERFTIEREVADYERLYERLVAPPARRLNPPAPTPATPEHSFDFRAHWRRALEKHDASENRLGEIVQQPFAAQLARILAVAAPERARVLELGAGAATVSRLLARQFAGTFFGLDILPEAAAVARRAANGQLPVHLVVADAMRAPFAAESFDLVFSQGLVEHFADPAKIFTAHALLVKPAGYLVINTPHKYNLYTVYKHWRMRRGRWEPGWETEYSAGQLAALGQRCGLEVAEINGHGSFLRAVVVRLLRRVVPARAREVIVRSFDAADRVLGRRLRAMLCQNVVVSFRKPSGKQPGEAQWPN